MVKGTFSDENVDRTIAADEMEKKVCRKATVVRHVYHQQDHHY